VIGVCAVKSCRRQRHLLPDLCLTDGCAARALPHIARC